jgi:4-amino-4-deoxy-L-arabinose transferase-like glycosyltransferase
MNLLNSLESAISNREVATRLKDIVTWLLIVGIAVLVVLMALQRRFDHDEFEAIKSTWKIFMGESIYVDFFQHHPPFLYYLLMPLLSLLGETKMTIYAARALMLCFTLGSLVMVHELARLLFSRRVAAVSVLFLLSVTMFVGTAIEVRPDVPQTFFGLLSLWLLYRFFDSGRKGLLVLSALFLSLGFLFLQKMIFLILLMHSVLFYRVMRRQLRWSLLVQFSVLLLAVWGGYCLYLAYTGELAQYWFFNFAFNMASRGYSMGQAIVLIKHMAGFKGIVLLGLLLGLFATRTQPQRELAVMAISLLGFAVCYRAQYAQYYMSALPLVAIIAAAGWETIAQRHCLAAVVCLAAASLPSSANYAYEAFARNNHYQLARIEYVLEHTQASDYVYDGNITFNLFRKDIDFFWYSVSKGRLLDKYKRLTGYRYDIYKIIDKYEPKIISDHGIDDMRHPVIQKYYRKDPVYEDLYLRIG